MPFMTVLLALDTILHNTTIKINTLRNRVSIDLLLVKDLQSEIGDRRQAISQAMWNQEEAPFFQSCATDYDSSLLNIIQDGLYRSTRVIRIFMRTTWDTRSLNLGIWFLLLIWFLVILHMVRKKPEQENVFRNLTFLKKSALLSSLLLLVTYGPFLYASAPAVYIHLNELFRLLLLSILLFPYLTKQGKVAWLALAANMDMVSLLTIFCWIQLMVNDGA